MFYTNFVGPLFAKLKSGACVTLENGTVIQPDQVLEESVPGRYVSVVCSIELKDKKSLNKLISEKIFKR